MSERLHYCLNYCCYLLLLHHQQYAQMALLQEEKMDAPYLLLARLGLLLPQLHSLLLLLLLPLGRTTKDSSAAEQ